MFIHIGDRKSVSDKHLIAILNCETVVKSPEINSGFIDKIGNEDKTMAICMNSIITTKVSSYTVIKRYGQISDAVWSKKI
ncbi:MAG: hypothetical protein AB1444_02925 [Spirochaetota bacterium]